MVLDAQASSAEPAGGYRLFNFRVHYLVYQGFGIVGSGKHLEAVDIQIMRHRKLLKSAACFAPSKQLANVFSRFRSKSMEATPTQTAFVNLLLAMGARAANGIEPTGRA